MRHEMDPILLKRRNGTGDATLKQSTSKNLDMSAGKVESQQADKLVKFAEREKSTMKLIEE